MGCLADGVKFAHCNECEIRYCAKSKGYETCGGCSQLDTCPTVGFILQIVPDAKANLQSIVNH